MTRWLSHNAVSAGTRSSIDTGRRTAPPITTPSATRRAGSALRRGSRRSEVLILVTALAVGAVGYAPQPVAVAGGLLLALVLPGLGLGAILANGFGAGSRASSRLSGIERVVLAPALSLAVLVLGGLLLNAAGIALNRQSWAPLTVTVTLLATTASLLIRRYAGGGAPLTISRTRVSVRAAARVAVPLLLGVSLLAGAVWISYDSAAVQARTNVTALSAVPVAGAAPIVLVDLTSWERTPVTFRLRISAAASTAVELDVAVKPGATWTRRITVPAGRLDIELYRPGNTAPYRQVSVGSSA